MSLTGSYTIQCLINNTTTSVACTQTITGTPPTAPPPTPVCNYLHVNPQG